MTKYEMEITRIVVRLIIIQYLSLKDNIGKKFLLPQNFQIKLFII